MASTVLFHANPTSGVPIYRQLVEQVLLLVASGRLSAGDWLPSVRQVAQDLQVNPMTVSRAYSLLEHDGVVALVRGTGMRVLPQRAPANLRDRQAELSPLITQLVARSRQLDLSPAQLLALLTTALSENSDD
jgi:GntR family transcriptional regulator